MLDDGRYDPGMLSGRRPNAKLWLIASILVAVTVLLVLPWRATPEVEQGAHLEAGIALAPVLERPPADVARSAIPEPATDIVVPTTTSPSRPRGRLPSRQTIVEPFVRMPVGVLEVVVLQGAGVHESVGLNDPEVPLAGVPIAIRGPNAEAPPERPEDVASPTDWMHTNARGIARFEAREPGTYWIRAWLGDDVVLTGQAELTELRGMQYVLRVGEGVVHGRIFTAEGLPWQGTRFDLNVSADAGHPITRSTQTDADGRFRFDRVPSSFCLLTQEWASQAPGWRAARARFALAPNEIIELSFGSESPLVPWTGRLRASSGEPIERGVVVDLDDAEQGRTHQFLTEGDGRFRCELPPGEYLVGPEGGWGTAGFLRVRVGPGPLERDLVFPLVSLRLITAPEEFARYTAFELVRSDGVQGAIEVGEGLFSKSVQIERYALRVPPARYRLVAQGSGRIAGATDEGLDLDLAGKSGLVSIDVPLVPR